MIHDPINRGQLDVVISAGDGDLMVFEVQFAGRPRPIGRMSVELLRDSSIGPVVKMVSASIDPEFQHRGVGTFLYEHVAAYACTTWGVPLSSSTALSDLSESFWRKQEQLGRARRWYPNRYTHAYVLTCPPPATLRNSAEKWPKIRRGCTKKDVREILRDSKSWGKYVDVEPENTQWILPDGVICGRFFGDHDDFVRAVLRRHCRNADGFNAYREAFGAGLIRAWLFGSLNFEFSTLPTGAQTGVMRGIADDPQYPVVQLDAGTRFTGDIYDQIVLSNDERGWRDAEAWLNGKAMRGEL